MTTKEYLQLNHEFTDAEMKALKRSDRLCGRKAKLFVEFKYIDFIKIMNKIKDNDILGSMVLVLSLDKKIDLEEIMKAPYKDFVYFSMWFKDQVDLINNLNNNLQTEEDSDLISAGIENLEIFEEINIIDSLANGDITKWAYIYNLKFKEIYTKLLKNKIESEIKDNLITIQKQKQKQK